ncbi:MAG TPA: histidine phosphatase family protein, partial [Planctomycetota bacterium]|nr:histidine phosphatase family protein [Planctomycetota bacterium]
MTAAARIWLVRHGETAGQSSIRYHGRNDVPLSDLGRAQVRALVPWLSGLQPVAVVHSPLARAAESAAILAEGCGFAPALLRVDAALSEISFGDCEGMTAQEIAARHPEFWAEHLAGRADAFPGGESKVAFGARIRTAIAALA